MNDSRKTRSSRQVLMCFAALAGAAIGGGTGARAGVVVEEPQAIELPDLALPAGPEQPLYSMQVANPADAAASASAEARKAAREAEREGPPPTERELELERRVAELERAAGIRGPQRGESSDGSSPSMTFDDNGHDASGPRLRSWEMPAVTVVGEGSGLREEDRIGKYGQPRWTATRRFPGTRVYVIPEGKVEVEYWLRPTLADDGGPTEIRSLYEIEIGLPHRFQLDLYLRTDQDSNESETLLGQQVELRYALADWGKIWGNPTLYFEWVGLEQRPDKVEFKLLLGDELAPRWHWGVNLVAELETGGEREYEYQFTGGLSYTVIDEKFSVGAELQALFADVKGDRGDFSQTYYLGPSFQYRPMPAFTINFAPLVGIGPDAGDARFFLNLGYEF